MEKDNSDKLNSFNQLNFGDLISQASSTKNYLYDPSSFSQNSFTNTFEYAFNRFKNSFLYGTSESIHNNSQKMFNEINESTSLNNSYLKSTKLGEKLGTELADINALRQVTDSRKEKKNEEEKNEKSKVDCKDILSDSFANSQSEVLMSKNSIFSNRDNQDLNKDSQAILNSSFSLKKSTNQISSSNLIDKLYFSSNRSSNTPSVRLDSKISSNIRTINNNSFNSFSLPTPLSADQSSLNATSFSPETFSSSLQSAYIQSSTFKSFNSKLSSSNFSLPLTFQNLNYDTLNPFQYVQLANYFQLISQYLENVYLLDNKNRS